MIPDRPLDRVTSIKAKLAVLVVASILVATAVAAIGEQAEVPWWISLPVTIAAALGLTQWLARGMTSPLREMTGVAGRMAGGDYDQQVTATSSDEVGVLARAFNTMARDLARSDAQRRQLVATVSHELRTPLSAQRALLENLVDGVAAPDDGALEVALAQAERLSDLVADLLDLSRIDAGQAALRLGPVRVADLLDRGVAEARLEARPVRHEVTVTPPDLTVEGDPGRLAQVVANLLDNAARHSPVGGPVRVSAAASGEGAWTLEVADDGPGIRADRADRVFERFGTGEDSGGGTGLGLAIARWVCELHGGTIVALAPEPGRSGARIRATLPRRTPGVTPPATAPGVTPPATVQEDPVPVPRTAPAPAPGLATHPATYAAVPVAPVMDTVFGRLWPEVGLGPQPRWLLASLGVGLLAALALPYHPVGLAALGVLLASGGVVLAASGVRARPWTVVSAVLAVAAGTLVVLRASLWLSVLAVLAAGVLTTTALTQARSLPAIVAGPVAWVLAGVRGLPLLGRTLAAASRRRLLWPVARTAAISVIVLVVFGALFASGDALFGAWADAVVPSLDLAGFTFRTFVFVLAGGILLAGCYLSLNPPRVNTLAPPRPRPVAHAWEWLVPVGLVAAVFATFLLAQATALVGGHDYVQRTTGLTYADYVHQGFGQLTVATALTLVVVAVAAGKAPVATSRDRVLLRGMLGALGVMTLLVVASALHRMATYQQAYGFTTLRLVVDVFEAWLGLLVLLVLLAGVRMAGWWLARGALLAGVGLVLVLGMMNPDGWVAQRNIERYHVTGSLDAAYLATLGDDAVPAIVRGRLPAPMVGCILGAQESNRGPMEASGNGAGVDLLGWNLGRARAATLRGEVEPLDPTSPACLAVLAPSP